MRTSVRDAERKNTYLKSKQERKNELQEVLRIVRERRLEDATEEQLDLLNAFIELKKELDPPEQLIKKDIDIGHLQDLIAGAVSKALSGSVQLNQVAVEPDRPEMRAVEFNPTLKIEDVEINAEDIGESRGSASGSKKAVEKLKKLKGK